MDFVEFGSPIHAIEPAFLEREILDCEGKFRSDVNTWPLHFLKKFRASRKFSDLRMAIQSYAPPDGAAKQTFHDLFCSISTRARIGRAQLSSCNWTAETPGTSFVL